ncbi:MAG: DUF3536 domain-containing protein [Candidatus Bipolaricaulaceae bacterium]
MTDRYVCVHGHFYQPPRENPWLEAVEVQDSAYPFHDWNERVTAECYAPNSASRILDEEGRIADIVNNYAHISFNFGPTLLSWLESKRPDVYARILEADRGSRDRLSGHGNALAQPYNHIILPLANSRDRRTQVIWGVADFRRRFGRAPEGMWLPETAVDIPTLETLAEAGITFTILAPHQAARVRPLAGGEWQDVSGGRVDPTRPYRVRLPAGGELTVFFYHGPLAQAVAFEGLLRSGEAFAQRLMSAFPNQADAASLVHLATDGESYGHHHRHGDMALAYALHSLASASEVELTNYGEFLARHPPQWEVEIAENTSWSCAHGLDRWQADCGCVSGGRPEWNQSWRGPLREAFDWLRDALAVRFTDSGRELFKDPWAARDDYGHVVIARSPQSADQLLAQHAARELTPADKVRALKLLEMQRHAMLMYTSCGWFFAELSGIETVQVIRYAGRALQLAQELFGNQLETEFLARLERAKSNLPEHADGRQIYETQVRPARVDLPHVAAHYAISSLFDGYGERDSVYCFTVDRGDHQLREVGPARLAVGHARVTSQITWETAELAFGVLHLGDHNLSGGVKEYPGPQAYRQVVADLTRPFLAGDLPETLRALDGGFGPPRYSLRSLFRDEQRRTVDSILAATLSQVESEYQHIYEENSSLLLFLADLGIPAPEALRAAAQFVLNRQIQRALARDDPDLPTARGLVEEAQDRNLALDRVTLGHALAQALQRLARWAAAAAAEPARITEVKDRISAALDFPFEVDLWQVQNTYYEMSRQIRPQVEAQADAGDQAAQGWMRAFAQLGARLGFRVG